MREGSVFRRCRSCTVRVDARRCPRCGGDRITWAYQVDVNRIGERRRQRLKSGFATKGEAVAARNALVRDAADGSLVERNDVTVAGYVAEWLPAQQASVRGGTWRNYELLARRHIVPRIGDAKIQALSPASVRRLYAEVAATGRSIKTVHNIHMLLHRVLDDAVRDSIIARNPADRAHALPRHRTAGRRVWTAAQTSAFLDSVRGGRLFALWRLAATTGIRRGEFLALRWEDVDLDHGWLTVRRARVRCADGRLGYGPPKTRAGLRRIDLDTETLVALREQRRRQLEERLAYGPSWPDDDLIFCREDGQPLDPDGVTGAFDRLARRAGLPKIVLHDLRHGAASMLLAAGVNPKVVQERLGPASIQITLDLYSHVMAGLQADASAKLAALLDGTA
jgi:integrase